MIYTSKSNSLNSPTKSMMMMMMIMIIIMILYEQCFLSNLLDEPGYLVGFCYRFLLPEF